jgi:glycosyltransferase involved in cell wall biosynthesis
VTARVALIASTTADVGAPVLAARLEHLLRAGWDARLFLKGARWPEHPALSAPEVQGRVAFAPRASARSSPFDRQLRRWRPDLVHFHSGWAALKGLGRGQLADARVVISFRDDGQDLSVSDPDLLRRRADLLLFGHRAALERAVARGWPREKSEVLETPVGEAVADPPGPPARPADGAGLRILSAGPLIWEQGFEHSVHAVRLLLDAGHECRYRIVGEGDHLPAVAFARHQLGLGDRVEILAPESGERLARELRAADVFVDPSVTDTTSSSSLHAALSHGLPAVVTGRAGSSVNGSGIEVPRRDPRALADALSRLAADPNLRARMASEARRVGGDSPSANHSAELERMYRETLR